MGRDEFDLGVVLGEILAGVREILERLDMSAAQDAIDAATSAITTSTTDLDADAPLIEAQLGAGVSTDALTAAVAPLQAAVAGINALAHPVVSSPTTSSTTGVTTSHPTSSTVTTSVPVAPAAEPRKTVGSGAPGDPVREV